MGAWESWENPSKEYRIKPFWFWNGNIEKEEIDFQLRQMKEQGIGGAFICPRQGLSVPYLGREWMELVEYTCEREKNLDWRYGCMMNIPIPAGWQEEKLFCGIRRRFRNSLYFTEERYREESVL